MVYKKYIKKNGKTFGPYYYESYRKNGKVKTRFISGPEKKDKVVRKVKNNHLIFIFSLMIILILLSFVFIKYNDYLVGIISGNVIKIEISKAEHLDRFRNFIKDIYPVVSEKDDNWAVIKKNEYIKVRFEQNLTNKNDIKLYARSFDGNPVDIRVYQSGNYKEIATFKNILKEGWYKIYLNNIPEESDVFYLKVFGNVEIDYIIDPSPDMLWSKIYDCGALCQAKGNGVTTDNNENIYVTGSITGGCYTVKYDSNGNIIWGKSLDLDNGGINLNGEDCEAIAVDNNGNVYVAGSIFGGDRLLLIKYDSGGNKIWNKSLLEYKSRAFGIDVDNNGNVYVTGASNLSGNFEDCLTMKFDSNGNEIWKVSRGIISGGRDVVADNNGNVYVTGFTSGLDYLIIKYDSNGNEIWNTVYDAGGNIDVAFGIDVDSNGNVYVTGKGSNDYDTVKFNSNGNKIWSKSFDSVGGGTSLAQGIDVDNNGNVYVTGSAYNGVNSDYYTIKYDSSGNEIWNVSFDSGDGSNRNDEAHGIAVDNNGDVYVTGFASLGTGSFPNIYRNVFLTMKYSGDGGSCTPSCSGKECGSDGCGGSCGTCGAGETCNALGQCIGCTPSCSGKECGDDGCGGSCGNCGAGEICNENTGLCEESGSSGDAHGCRCIQCDDNGDAFCNYEICKTCVFPGICNFKDEDCYYQGILGLEQDDCIGLEYACANLINKCEDYSVYECSGDPCVISDTGCYLSNNVCKKKVKMANSYCGDGNCNTDETCLSCPGDCGICPIVCGDGNCNSDEDCSSCPSDCGQCQIATECNDNIDNDNDNLIDQNDPDCWRDINNQRTYDPNDNFESSCTEWSKCVANYGLSDLVDFNFYSFPFLKGIQERKCRKDSEYVVEKRICDSKANVIIKRGDCFKDQISIYNLNNNLISTLEFEETSTANNRLNIDFNFRESFYCSYCYDGVKNYDEDEVDCVYEESGSCPVCGFVPEIGMHVYSFKDKYYFSRRVLFNISVDKKVKIEYINQNDKNPKWIKLCNNCYEYGFKKRKLRTLNEGENNVTFRAIDAVGDVVEKNVVFYIDSKKPRIIKTLPKRNSFVNSSDFYVKYSEKNLEYITLFYGIEGNMKNTTKFDCEKGDNKECFFDTVDLSEFDGQEIIYYFDVSDIANIVRSRKTKINIDLISPILMIHLPEKTTYYSKIGLFNISISEKVKLEYINLDETGLFSRLWGYFGFNKKGKTLCSSCDEYGFSKKRTRVLELGNNTLLIRALDKAGNSDIKEVVVYVCDTRESGEEICDGFDNDCEGVVDEGCGCVKEGEEVAVLVNGPECCEGLEKISKFVLINGECQTAEGSMICSDCGNEICEEWENQCNCEEDCKQSICGNEICEQGEAGENICPCKNLNESRFEGQFTCTSECVIKKGTCPEDCEIICNSNSDCPGFVNSTACSGNALCSFYTSQICQNPGTTESECSGIISVGRCKSCEFGCDIEKAECKSECSDNEDCDVEKSYCENNKCFECLVNENCNDNNKCTIDSCIENVCSNAFVVCGESQTCNSNTGECGKKKCPNDFECDENTYCLEGQCVECLEDANCNPGYVCEDNVCNCPDIIAYIDYDSDGFGDPELPVILKCDYFFTLSELNFVLNDDDCNDSNQLVNPNMNETCDGIDNNCDGAVDTDCECVIGSNRTCGTSDVGVCEYGVQNCEEDVWRNCTGNTDPIGEVCGNSLDDDCDSMADEGCGVVGVVGGSGGGGGSYVGGTTTLPDGELATLAPEIEEIEPEESEEPEEEPEKGVLQAEKPNFIKNNLIYILIIGLVLILAGIWLFYFFYLRKYKRKHH